MIGQSTKGVNYFEKKYLIGPFAVNTFSNLRKQKDML